MKILKRHRITALSLSLVIASPFVLSACVPTTEPGEVGEEYVITLDYNDGVARDGHIYVDKEDPAVETPANPRREGYSFGGWYTEETGGDRVDFSTLTVTSDMTLYARWEAAAIDVTFDWMLDGAEDVTYQVEYGKSINQSGISVPAQEQAPANEGFSFRGWMTSESDRYADADFDAVIERDTTYYACWRQAGVDLFNVSYDLGYDSEEPEEADIYLSTDTRPITLPRPTRTGYTFLGWAFTEGGEVEYEGRDRFTPTAEMGTQNDFGDYDITLYAVWEQQKYTVNFINTVRQEQTVVEVRRDVPFESEIDAPAADPVREGYTFLGWYTAATGGEKVEFPVQVTSSTSYYAHWQSVDVVTDVFDAEYTYIDPAEGFPGYSGGTTGYGIIRADRPVAGNTLGATTQHDAPGNEYGYYVTYQYKKGATVRFVINSSQAVSNVTLVARLATEQGSVTFGPTGDNVNQFGYKFVVNGTALDYAPITPSANFADFTISTSVSLKQGENVIELIVDNDRPSGTMTAVGPTIDCIKLSGYGSAQLSWKPEYDNIYQQGVS